MATNMALNRRKSVRNVEREAAAKVLQSEDGLRSRQRNFLRSRGCSPERRCNPIRRLHVQRWSLARTPGQTRLDFSQLVSLGDTQPSPAAPPTIETGHTCACAARSHVQTECVIGAAQFVGADLHFLPPPARRLASLAGWEDEDQVGQKGASLLGGAGPHRGRKNSTVDISTLTLPLEEAALA